MTHVDAVKIWEVQSIDDSDEDFYSQGLYSTVEIAKASVLDADWREYRATRYSPWFASVYDGDGGCIRYFIRERELITGP